MPSLGGQGFPSGDCCASTERGSTRGLQPRAASKPKPINTENDRRYFIATPVAALGSARAPGRIMNEDGGLCLTHGPRIFYPERGSAAARPRAVRKESCSTCAASAARPRRHFERLPHRSMWGESPFDGTSMWNRSHTTTDRLLSVQSRVREGHAEARRGTFTEAPPGCMPPLRRSSSWDRLPPGFGPAPAYTLRIQPRGAHQAFS